MGFSHKLVKRQGSAVSGVASVRMKLLRLRRMHEAEGEGHWRPGYACLAILAAITCVTLVAPLHRIGFFLEEANESWNTTHTLHASDHDPYAPPGGFIINNYPRPRFWL